MKIHDFGLLYYNFKKTNEAINPHCKTRIIRAYSEVLDQKGSSSLQHCYYGEKFTKYDPAKMHIR